MAHNARGYAQLGEKFRPPAWPLKSVLIEAKIQLFSRITNVERPSSFAQLRIGDVGCSSVIARKFLTIMTWDTLPPSQRYTSWP